MSSLKKSDKKAALDFAAWSFNVSTSVGIIMVNKALMATHGFTFGTSVPFIYHISYSHILIVFVAIEWYNLMLYLVMCLSDIELNIVVNSYFSLNNKYVLS
jgi:hypothetical protein